jgi:hypothetical protein
VYPASANPVFSWMPSALATGYNLSLGTTPGGTELLNNMNVGNVTSYTLPFSLPLNDTFYVSLTPYNGNGPAIACAVSAFTTTPLPQWFNDPDGDGYGDPGSVYFSLMAPPGFVNNGGDCNENDNSINPGATDICDNGIDEDCSGSDSTCTGSASLNVRVFIEGYYLGGSLMAPVLYYNGLSLSTTDCDSITIELRDPLSPSSIMFTQNAMLLTNGYASVPLPPAVIGNSYFIVVKHRNSIETWSKTPVVMVNGTTLFDFTQ